MIALFSFCFCSLSQTGNIVIPSAHDGKILNILIDDKSKYYYTADEWKIIMWDFSTNKQLFTFPISNKSITQHFGDDVHNLKYLHLSPNGNLIAFTTKNNELKIFSTETGKLINTIQNVMSDFIFSQNSKTIYDISRGPKLKDGVQSDGRMVRNINVITGEVKDYWHLPELNIWGTYIRYFYPLSSGRVINFNEKGYQVLDLDNKKELIKVDMVSQLSNEYQNVEEFNRYDFTVYASTSLFSFQSHRKKEGLGYTVWDIYNNKPYAFISNDRNVQMQSTYNTENFFYTTKSNRYDKQDAIIISNNNKTINQTKIIGVDEIRLGALSNKGNTIIYCGLNNKLYKYDLSKSSKELISQTLPNIQFASIHRNGDLISFAEEKDYYNKSEDNFYHNLSTNYLIDLNRLQTLNYDTLPIKSDAQLSSLRINKDSFLLGYEGKGFSIYNANTKRNTPFVLKGFSDPLGSKYNPFPTVPEFFVSKKPSIMYAISYTNNMEGYNFIKYNTTTKQVQTIFGTSFLKGDDWENRRYDDKNLARTNDLIVVDKDNEIMAAAEVQFKGTLRIIDMNSGKLLAKHPFSYNPADYKTLSEGNDSGIMSEGINNFPYYIYQIKKIGGQTVRVLGMEKIYELNLTDGSSKEIEITTPKFIGNKRNIRMYGNNKIESIITTYETESGAVAETIFGPYKFRLTNISSPVQRVEFSKNDSILYTINEDKTINAYDAISGKYFGTLYIFENSKDWVFVAKDGRFDGTENGMRRLYYLKNREIISIDKVFEKYFTPGLFTRLKNGEVFDPIPHIDFKPKPRARVLYAEAKRNLEVEDDIPSFINTSGVAEITISAIAPEDKVDEIRLFHNGKAVNLATRGLFVTDNDGTDSKKYTIDLLPGVNNFRAIALNSQRTESEPDEILVNYKKEGAAPSPIKPENKNTVMIDPIDRNATLHIVVVGINAYKNKINPLSYAVPDATAFKAELEKDAQSIIGNVKSYLITDDQADKTGIMKAFETIKKSAKAQDVFVFYYAGHGYIHPSNKEFYLVSADVADGGESLLKNGISSKELQSLAVAIPAQKQLFIMDACQSAGAFEKMLQHDGEQQKALAVVSRSTGTHWMAASGSTETAKEFGELGHGVFTYSLLEALKGKAANNKMITVNGLKNYLQTIVPELIKKYGGNSQYPASYGFGNDFPVEILK